MRYLAHLGPYREGTYTIFGMRIGFDAKRLFHNDTGLGVYSRLLVENLAKIAPEHEIILYDRAPAKSDYYHEFSHFEIHSSHAPLWRTRGITRSVVRDGCDLYHGLSHELPLGLERTSVRRIVTIHDLIFERYPSLYAPIDRYIYRQKWKHACAIADRIICISEATKQDLIEFYGIGSEKIDIVPPLHSVQFEKRQTHAELEGVRQQYHLPSEFIVYVGAIVPRKGLLRIMQALGRLDTAVRPPLVVVGQGGAYLKECRKAVDTLNLSKWVHWCDYISNTDLPAIYQMATALVYPSLFEGFGIPVVESLFSGTPVITSDRSSLPEAAGPGALLVDPEDVDALADAIKTLVHDATLQVSLIRKSADHLDQLKNPSLVWRLLVAYQS